jgi:hypothetical protein
VRLRITHFETADSSDRPAQPHQIIPVELIGSAEVVDDLGDRPAGFRMAHVVGELEILDHRSIFIFASRRS